MDRAALVRSTGAGRPEAVQTSVGYAAGIDNGRYQLRRIAIKLGWKY